MAILVGKETRLLVQGITGRKDCSTPSAAATTAPRSSAA